MARPAKIYVLQEGTPRDDISVVETFEEVEIGDPSWTERTLPSVEASAPKGAIRSWCEERRIMLAPKEFFPGQIDYVLSFGTADQRQAF
jgi:hypothetical protein